MKPHMIDTKLFSCVSAIWINHLDYTIWYFYYQK